MVRFVISLLVSALLLGAVGVCQYALTDRFDFSLTDRPETHGHADRDITPESGPSYRLEITLGFMTGDDPFAVRTADEAEAPRLVVRQGPRVVFAAADALQRGRTIAVTNLSFKGDSAMLFVEAVPGPGDAPHPCSLRLRMRRDGVVCDEATLWSEGGGTRVSGEVRLSLAPDLATLDRGLGTR